MLPFKRIISSLLIAILLVTGAWLLTSKNKKDVQRVAGIEKANFAVSEIDTDGDALMDWEERLWRTDVNNKDTDFDGTSDGEEVSLERDPTAAGPNDSLKETILSRSSSIKSLSESKDLNFSETFGRSIFSTYMAKNTSGQSSSDQVEALEVLLAEKLPPAKDYVLSDLLISSSSDLSALRTYGNSVATILSVDAAAAESELTIFARAVERKDPVELQKMDEVTGSLELKAQLLVKTSVPLSLAEAHLSFINSLESARYDIEGMKLVFEDPMLAFLALNSYRTTSGKVVSDLVAVKNLLAGSGVVFVESEPGFKIFGK